MSETKKKIGEMFVGESNNAEIWGGLVFMIIVIILLLLLGEYLWNDVLSRVVTVVKPIKSVWELIAIMFLAKLILC